MRLHVELLSASLDAVTLRQAAIKRLICVNLTPSAGAMLAVIDNGREMMKSPLTCSTLVLAVMFAPIVAGSAFAEDAHHQGKAATTKSAPAPAKKKARKAKTSMMSNCQMMQGGGRTEQPGGMNCLQDRANMSGLMHGMMHSMMMGNGTMMGHGNTSRGH